MKLNVLSKKVSFLVVLLVFIVMVFATLSVEAEAPGGVGCEDLANCTGTGRCTDYGSVTGCFIDCAGGGAVICDWKTPDPS
jgi:hypothetical protein